MNKMIYLSKETNIGYCIIEAVSIYLTFFSDAPYWLPMVAPISYFITWAIIYKIFGKQRRKMILPENHVLEYNGVKYNWFVGDAVSYPKVIKFTFWAWAVPIENGFNTRKAVYCGKFNTKTREIYDIGKLAE